MAETILVVAEQREGKLNRVSFETLRAAQSIAAETGWPIQAALLGAGINTVASELAAAKLSKVFAIELAALRAVQARLDGAFSDAVELIADVLRRRG